MITHKIQIIAMSATMGGLDGMCTWLDAVGLDKHALCDHGE